MVDGTPLLREIFSLSLTVIKRATELMLTPPEFFFTGVLWAPMAATPELILQENFVAEDSRAILAAASSALMLALSGLPLLEGSCAAIFPLTGTTQIFHLCAQGTGDSWGVLNN